MGSKILKAGGGWMLAKTRTPGLELDGQVAPKKNETHWEQHIPGSACGNAVWGMRAGGWGVPVCGGLQHGAVGISVVSGAYHLR